jgi:hypothetical protein
LIGGFIATVNGAIDLIITIRWSAWYTLCITGSRVEEAGLVAIAEQSIGTGWVLNNEGVVTGKNLLSTAWNGTLEKSRHRDLSRKQKFTAAVESGC